MIKSQIHPSEIKSEGIVNGRYVAETVMGTLVCDRAPLGIDESLTFTAFDGLRYWDTLDNSRFTPRSA